MMNVGRENHRDKQKDTSLSLKCHPKDSYSIVTPETKDTRQSAIVAILATILARLNMYLKFPESYSPSLGGTLFSNSLLGCFH